MAWTETTRRHYRREALRYASDLTNEEWALIAPFLPTVSKPGLEAPRIVCCPAGGN